MISIIDYGAGNIFSVKNALDYLGLESRLTRDKNDIENADAIILPGVGAFPSAMNMLGNTGLIDTIKEQAKQKPFLGICLGMQVAVIEYARNVLGLKAAHSTELDENTPYGVIHLMPEQEGIDEKGGTMRLGLYPCKVAEGTKAFEAYGEDLVFERHRHRYEFNDKYLDDFTKHGMIPVGINPESNLVEIIEIPSHKWFVGVQFHPEYSSTVMSPHPLFVNFVRACIG